LVRAKFEIRRKFGENCDFIAATKIKAVVAMFVLDFCLQGFYGVVFENCYRAQMTLRVKTIN